jgi:hypothetical protein
LSWLRASRKVGARERVLAEIADGLERGSIAQPAGAVFLGELE